MFRYHFFPPNTDSDTWTLGVGRYPSTNTIPVCVKKIKQKDVIFFFQQLYILLILYG